MNKNEMNREKCDFANLIIESTFKNMQLNNHEQLFLLSAKLTELILRNTNPVGLCDEVAVSLKVAVEKFKK